MLGYMLEAPAKENGGYVTTSVCLSTSEHV
jgi:hypothetical protein